MSHIGMSHVTHVYRPYPSDFFDESCINESCQKYGWVEREKESCHTYGRVVSQMCIDSIP